MRKVLAAAALVLAPALALTGCGGSQAPAQYAPTSSGGGGYAPSSPQSSEASSGGATATSSTGIDSAMTRPPQPVAPGTQQPTTMQQPDAQFTRFQSQIDDGMRELSSASECRDICRAASNICVAAREICVLTGDNESQNPMDGRCTRARGSCEQASRQRGTACPVCPQG